MKLRLNVHAQYEYMDFCAETKSKKCVSDKNSRSATARRITYEYSIDDVTAKWIVVNLASPCTSKLSGAYLISGTGRDDSGKCAYQISGTMGRLA